MMISSVIIDGWSDGTLAQAWANTFFVHWQWRRIRMACKKGTKMRNSRNDSIATSSAFQSLMRIHVAVNRFKDEEMLVWIQLFSNGLFHCLIGISSEKCNDILHLCTKYYTQAHTLTLWPTFTWIRMQMHLAAAMPLYQDLLHTLSWRAGVSYNWPRKIRAVLSSSTITLHIVTGFKGWYMLALFTLCIHDALELQLHSEVYRVSNTYHRTTL